VSHDHVVNEHATAPESARVVQFQPELGSPLKTVREIVDDWLRRRVRTEAGVAPDIASIEWVRLPDNHPLKLAAVCRAARAWVSYTDPATIESDLRDELEAAAHVKHEVLDQAYAASIRRIATGPTRAEIERRRAAATAAIGRPWTREELGAA
jgi:hypothetical protein